MDHLWNLRIRFDPQNGLIPWKTLLDSLMAQRILGTLVAGGLTFKLNGMLNDWAYNNFSSNRSWDWEREIVLVTGGSSGIGEQIVRKLADRDIKVIVFDIATPETPFPAGVFYYNVDITSPEAVKSAADTLRKHVGEPTVLVNNAGIGFANSIFSETEEMNRKLFSVNSLAHFILVKEFVPSMIRNDHGHIVTISSLASFVTVAGNVSYSCSKAAITALHEGLRQEIVHVYNAKHVRTSIVHPLWVRTPMNSSLHEKFGKDILEAGEVADRIVQQIMSGKSGQIIMPSSYWTAPMVRGLPDWVQEWIRGSRSGVIPVKT